MQHTVHETHTRYTKNNDMVPCDKMQKEDLEELRTEHVIEM